MLARAAVAGLLLTALAGAACIDFGLDGRRFRCAEDPQIFCGQGWSCVDGFCERDTGDADAAVEVCGNQEDDDDDGDVDCLDTDCGQESCYDPNPCTVDTCEATGACAHDPVPAESPCGTGCLCRAGGLAEELACGDRLDNDGDDLPDCRDSDCPACAGDLTCCPDGSCSISC